MQAGRDSRFEPALSRALEPHRDDRLACAFGHPAADREASLARGCIADLRAVVLEGREMALHHASRPTVHPPRPPPWHFIIVAVSGGNRTIEPLVEFLADLPDRRVAAIEGLAPA